MAIHDSEADPLVDYDEVADDSDVSPMEVTAGGSAQAPEKGNESPDEKAMSDVDDVIKAVPTKGQENTPPKKRLSLGSGKDTGAGKRGLVSSSIAKASTRDKCGSSVGSEIKAVVRSEDGGWP